MRNRKTVLGKFTKTVSMKFEHLDKDELINRLIWLQLKDTMKDYENAPDLNAGFDNRRLGGGKGSEPQRKRTVIYQYRYQRRSRPRHPGPFHYRNDSTSTPKM